MAEQREVGSERGPGLAHRCWDEQSHSLGHGFTAANAYNVVQGDRVRFQHTVNNISVFPVARSAPSLQTNTSTLSSIDGNYTSERDFFIQVLTRRRKGKLNDFLTEQLEGNNGSALSLDVQRSPNGQLELVFLVDATEMNRLWRSKYPTETARRGSNYFVNQILKNARFDETTPLGATRRTFRVPNSYLVTTAGHVQVRGCVASSELSLPGTAPDSVPMVEGNQWEQEQMQMTMDHTSPVQESESAIMLEPSSDLPENLDTFNALHTNAEIPLGDQVPVFDTPLLPTPTDASAIEDTSTLQLGMYPIWSPCTGGRSLVVYGIPLEEGEDYFLTFTGKKKSLSVATVNQDPKAGLVLISVSPSHEIPEKVAVEVVSRQSGSVNQETTLEFEFRDDLPQGASIWLRQSERCFFQRLASEGEAFRTSFAADMADFVRLNDDNVQTLSSATSSLLKTLFPSLCPQKLQANTDVGSCTLFVLLAEKLQGCGRDMVVAASRDVLEVLHNKDRFVSAMNKVSEFRGLQSPLESVPINVLLKTLEYCASIQQLELQMPASFAETPDIPMNSANVKEQLKEKESDVPVMAQLSSDGSHGHVMPPVKTVCSVIFHSLCLTVLVVYLSKLRVSSETTYVVRMCYLLSVIILGPLIGIALFLPRSSYVVFIGLMAMALCPIIDFLVPEDGCSRFPEIMDCIGIVFMVTYFCLFGYWGRFRAFLGTFLSPTNVSLVTKLSFYTIPILNAAMDLTLFFVGIWSDDGVRSGCLMGVWYAKSKMEISLVLILAVPLKVYLSRASYKMDDQSRTNLYRAHVHMLIGDTLVYFVSLGLLIGSQIASYMYALAEQRFQIALATASCFTKLVFVIIQARSIVDIWSHYKTCPTIETNLQAKRLPNETCSPTTKGVFSYCTKKLYTSQKFFLILNYFMLFVLIFTPESVLDLLRVTFLSNFEVYTMFLMGVTLIWMSIVMLLTYVTVRRYSKNRASPEAHKRGAHRHKPPGGSLLTGSLTCFAAFSALLAAFQIVDYSQGVSSKCSTPTAIACCAMKLLFIPTQVGLIKYSQRYVTFPKSLVNGMMVLQVIVTNIIIYTWTFIKSKEGVLAIYKLDLPPTVQASVLHQGTTHSPSANSSVNQTKECATSIYSEAFPWLYPFFLEFCLTASAMLAEQWLECPPPPTTTQAQTQGDESEHEHREAEQNGEKLDVCGARAIGVFAFVAHIGVIVFLIVETDSVKATIIWYASRAITSTAIIVLSAMGLKTLSSCKRNEKSSGFELDEVLLLIGNVGAFALASFRGFPGLISLKEGGYASGVAITEIVVIVGTFLQTAFISMALHREPSKSGCITTASIATIVGLLNLSLWLSNTVDVEGLDHGIYRKDTNEKINELQLARYESSWVIFLLLCFPVAIFYRIHSAVVLYRISKTHRHVSDRTELGAVAAVPRVCVWREMEKLITECDNLLLKKENLGVSKGHKVVETQTDPTAEERLERELRSFTNENERLLQMQNNLRRRWRDYLNTLSPDDQQRYPRFIPQFEELNQQLGADNNPHGTPRL